MRFILLALLLAAIVQPAAAQVGRNALFTVSGVATEATAESAAAARQPALNQGQKRALQVMLRRLTLAADQGRLPNVSEAELQALVRNIQVQEERSAGTRYAARLTVDFDANGIRNLLRGAGIPFTEAVAKPLLLIPVYDVDGRRMLWEENNPWRQAWAARANDESLLPISVPLGDSADNDLLDATRAASLDEARLRQLAERYKLADVAVASAVVRRNNSGHTLQVTVTRLGAGNEATLVLSYNGTGDNPAAAMEEAVRDIAVRLEDRWKQATIFKPSEGGPAKLSALVPLANLGDWIAVRDRLTRVTGVSRLDIVALTKQDAQVQFTFAGEPQQLALLLAQRDLDLAQGGDGYWTLRLKGAR